MGDGDGGLRYAGGSADDGEQKLFNKTCGALCSSKKPFGIADENRDQTETELKIRSTE